jgi:hypothetical protein
MKAFLCGDSAVFLVLQFYGSGEYDFVPLT